MLKAIGSFLIGAIVGAGGFWYFVHGPGQTQLEVAAEQAASEASRVKQAITTELREIRAEDIREELARSSMVVREKARQAGAVLADSRITAILKAKLVKEPGLSALAINVDTSDGLVTLSGTVRSHEQIARAVKLALETEGVHKVISTLQVK